MLCCKKWLSSFFKHLECSHDRTKFHENVPLWTSRPSLTRLGELTVLCLFVRPGLPRRVESCLNRVRLEPSPAATNGTWQPEFELFFSLGGGGDWGGDGMAEFKAIVLNKSDPYGYHNTNQNNSEKMSYCYNLFSKTILLKVMSLNCYTCFQPKTLEIIEIF